MRPSRLNPTLGRFIAQLQASVEAIDALDIGRPAVALQQDLDAPISVSHSHLADVFDPVFEGGLVAAFRLVDVERAINPKGRAGPPDRDLPVASQLADKLALRPGFRAFLRARPAAWPCPTTDRNDPL